MYCPQRRGVSRNHHGPVPVGWTHGIGHGREDLGVLCAELFGVLRKVLLGDLGLSGGVRRVLLEELLVLPSLLSLGLEGDEEVALRGVLRGRSGLLNGSLSGHDCVRCESSCARGAEVVPRRRKGGRRRRRRGKGARERRGEQARWRRGAQYGG